MEACFKHVAIFITYVRLLQWSASGINIRDPRIGDGLRRTHQSPSRLHGDATAEHAPHEHVDLLTFHFFLLLANPKLRLALANNGVLHDFRRLLHLVPGWAAERPPARLSWPDMIQL